MDEFRRAGRSKAAAILIRLCGLWGGLCAMSGCNTLMNGWLDFTSVGNFDQSNTLPIRSALTLEDSPSAIPAAREPTPADQVPNSFAYPFRPADILDVEILSLQAPNVVFQERVLVSENGMINLPVLGHVTVNGLTLVEVEELLSRLLRERDFLKSPQVRILPVQQSEATYSIFGIGASAAANAPLRAGTARILRPDYRLLEAINNVGGLNEFVTEIYVFRDERALQALKTSTEAVEARMHEEASESSHDAAAGGGGVADVLKNAVGDADASKNPPGGAEAPPPDGTEKSVPELEAPSENGAGNPATTADQEREAIIQMIEEGGKKEAGSEAGVGGEEPEMPSGEDAAASGSAEPPLAAKTNTPWIWTDDGFVPNPDYKPEEGEAEEGHRLPTWEALEQETVNWDRLAGDADYSVIRVPADALRNADREYNIVIRPKDTIRIVSGEIGVYYVMGQVARVGPFPFNAEQVTLKTAVATAGGLGPLAWPSRCTIYRRHGMSEQMIQVNMDKIFAGKEPDVVVRRGDIINVGTSPFAPFIQRLRAWTLPNPAATLGYSFTYSRNFADIDSFAVQPNPDVARNNRFPNLFP